MIRLTADGKVIPFETSVFPDGTSQVWKLKDYIRDRTNFKIDFIWDNKESEIFQLFMLLDLVYYSNDIFIHLNMPYLPYARQDKSLNSDSTFALTTFALLLNSKKVDLVTSFDVHSKRAVGLINNFHSLRPENFHRSVYNQFKPDATFYPDRGAAGRYSVAPTEILLFANKFRNQQTGEITGYEIVNERHFDLNGKRVLIVDDICDGGATFIEAAKALKSRGVAEIALCVSHGLFSKGLDGMKEAGISQFFTTNSLLKNKEGFNIYE